MDSGNIKVFVRVRPPNEREQLEGLCIEVLTNETIKIRESTTNSTATRFSFDGIFDMNSTQKDVFDIVGRSLISKYISQQFSVFQGINGTTFTYGQTASGKTYTCMGPESLADENRGLIPRVIEEVFRKIDESEGVIEFCLKVTLVEIYQQRVRDLLDTQKSDLKIRQNKAKGIYIQDATEKYVATAKEILSLIQEGSQNRSLGHTNMNEASSRSHMVFILTVHQNNLRDLSAKSAKLTLVDLAGSEKIAKTGAEGRLLDQAKHINKSLSALGNVINSLTETKIGHVPYRDSKLTRILQESLGGNAKTNLIINISPSIINESETISTLRFGHRAKNIKNKPKVNKEYTVPELLLLLEKAQLRMQQQDNIIKKLLSGEEIGLDFTANSKKSVKDVALDNSDDEMHSSIQPSRVNKLRSATYVSPLQAQYTESGLETEPEQRQLIDIRLLEMQIASEKKKSVRTGCELHRIKMENTELNRENVLLIQRYNICTTELERLQVKYDQSLQENSELIEKQSATEQQMQKLKQKNCCLKEAAEAYESIKHESVAIRRASLRSSRLIHKTEQQTIALQTELSYPVRMDVAKEVNPKKEDCLRSLSERVGELESQLAAYNGLEARRDQFEKEKEVFLKEKNGLLSDLANRIFKVVELEEELDAERSRRICLQQNAELSEKGQASRIAALENFISELTASYYVLKSQQLCWRTETRLFDAKSKRMNARIQELERELKIAKRSINELVIRISELNSENSTLPISVLKPNYDSNIRRSSGADIIKVIVPQTRTSKTQTAALRQDKTRFRQMSQSKSIDHENPSYTPQCTTDASRQSN